MAEAVVSLALETMKDLLLEEGRFLVGVRSEVKSLENQLKEIKCLLKDADRKQQKSETMRNWIKEIRDLAYRSEDVILEYAVRISSGERGGGIKRLGKRFSRVLHGCCSLHQIGSEVSKIKSELERLADNMKNEGIRSIIDAAENSANQNWSSKTFPNFEIDHYFIGMKDELERVESLLLGDKPHRVISVWGMGGLGKTTFAKKLYNDMKAKNERFNWFAWVCISQQFEIRKVLEDVLKQLCLDTKKGEGVHFLSDTQLIEQLCEIQREPCMIVLDDLWETSHWDELKHAFLVRNLQSKILVTTRNQKVAAHVGFSVELGLLNMNDAWELLKKKAFPGDNVPEFAFQEDVERIGKEMVQRCGYLPLAASLLGGVLSNKNHIIGDWEIVSENISGYLYGGEGHEEAENQIEQVMKLSYYDLPYSLKPCFLYLGKFKEGETIYAPNLYKLWIAQGMISDENFAGKTLTEIAELYLTELASRCIVQVELEDDELNQKYKKCRLHDVVRELCLSMCKKEDFGIQNLEYRGGKFSTLLNKALSRAKIRHLSIHLKEEIQLEGDEHKTTFNTSNSLRSLEITCDEKANKFPLQNILDIRKFTFLRCLVIFRLTFAKRNLPKGITDLVHLRHLALTGCVLNDLPQSISKLVYLHTLDLSMSIIFLFRDFAFKKMSRLKNLILPDKVFHFELDEGVEGLESLIRFDSSMHGLKCIARMKNLRRFSASISDNESLSAITNAISTNWNKLSYCKLMIEQDCRLTTNEEGLVNLKKAFSCPGLYSLKISVGLGKLLEGCIAEIICSKLVVLSLKNCELEDDPMPILGKLLFLRRLSLGLTSFVGEMMTSPAFSFPQLKIIEMINLPNLKEWIVEQGAMPIISKIYLHQCHGLQNVPDEFSNLSSLQELNISNMSTLRTRLVASASQSAVDFHKISHVPKIFCDFKPLSNAQVNKE